MLADRFWVKFVMSMSLFIGGLATFLMSWFSSCQYGLILRIITGLGAGCIYACCARVIINYFTSEELKVNVIMFCMIR